MRSTEAEVLKMMDRFSKNPFKPRQYEFRKRLYYSQLCMAYGFLKEHNFNRVILSNIPNNSFDFILFGLCKILRIEVSILHQSPLKDLFLHANSLEKLYTQLALPPQYAESHEWNLPDFLEQEIQNGPKIKALPKKPFSIQAFTSPFHTLSSWLAYTRIPKYKPTADTKFVYFPLQIEPDTNTSPMGGVFADQYYTILIIARALPDGVKVLVKEHPHQEMWQRNPDFYNLLKAEPKVEFVSPKQSSLELIKQSIAVSTITGSVGWKALFHQKPVILFGHTFYMNLPGVINVNDTESLTKAIAQIHHGEFKPCQLSDIRKLLHHTNKIAYQGVVNENHQPSTPQNKKSIKQALTDFITQ